MPIISQVGRRSLKVRLFIAMMYAMLIIGAISMIYPLLLMLAVSVTSEPDYHEITPLPRYLYDDDALWIKYLESKYASISEAEKSLFRSIGSWVKVTAPTIDPELQQRANEFRAFRQEQPWPLEWYGLGQIGYSETRGHPPNGRAWKNEIYTRYDGDIRGYSREMGIPFKSWIQIKPPDPPLYARRFNFPQSINYQTLDQIKQAAPLADRIVINLDAVFWQSYLRRHWSTITQYNQAHGTTHKHYDDVLLSARPPTAGQAQDDWENFVRFELNLAFIRLDPAITVDYQAFLSRRYEGQIDKLNRQWHTRHERFDQILLPQGIPHSAKAHRQHAAFVKDKMICPLDAMSIYGPRQGFEEYLARQRNTTPNQINPLPLPIESVDYLDFQEQTGALRWEFLTRNYKVVLNYIMLHGNGVRNTIIYCALMILVTLTINPLAAYALSRYKPPSTYTILLFCMCTMAFPPEVTMIPSFLLLKRFPIIGFAVAIVVGAGATWMFARLFPKLPDWVRGISAGVLALVAGFYLLPQMFGDQVAYVSLLNTFWALILPAAANGFGIFLLKGFFDSLPQELYEAAEIDGGGEWTKFWTITMSLSKPILAVLALQAFTAAYSEFMMALVIIPDEKMWTLMVWLFQLQIQIPPYVINASLVIAAIPTFLIFLFCQNIIMRGIIVPVEK